MSEGQIRRRRLITVMFAVLMAASLTPAFALADPGRAALGDASDAVYPVPAGEEALGSQGAAHPGSGSGSATATGDGSSGLPFTGFFAPALLVVGLLTLALGVGLRTVGNSRREGSAESAAP